MPIVEGFIICIIVFLLHSIGVVYGLIVLSIEPQLVCPSEDHFETPVLQVYLLFIAVFHLELRNFR